jgi:hypothetical protein
MNWKSILLVIILSVAISAKAQNEYSLALQKLSTNELSGIKLESSEDRIHVAIVAHTIRICTELNVQIEREAAISLDKIFETASATAAKEPKSSQNLRDLSAHTVRVVTHLISYAQTSQHHLVITRDSFEKAWTDFKSQFCPCFPFC